MGTPGCLLPAPSASRGVYREPEPRHSCQHAALQPLRKAPKPTVLRVSTSSQQKQPWCRRKLIQQDQKNGWKLCASAADLADAWPPDSSHREMLVRIHLDLVPSMDITRLNITSQCRRPLLLHQAAEGYGSPGRSACGRCAVYIDAYV